ncbi:MAG: hypothetical protein SFV51_17335 [Bryobacteraceae bacterium]|nr:hypothetical protein [Bryobacteraceae bacterium]
MRDIQVLLRVNEAVRLLHLLLSKYTRPCPELPLAELSEERAQYERRLDKLRTKASNLPDAQNLASVAIMCPSGEAARSGAYPNVTLVTGSKTVWEAGGDRTVDPFYFLIDAYYRRLKPGKLSRRKLIQSLLSDIYKILASMSELERESSDQKLMREEALQFLADLDALDQTAIQELGWFMNVATQSVTNARLQAGELSDDDVPGDFSALTNLSALKHRVQMLREMAQGATADRLGVKWNDIPSPHDEVRQYSLSYHSERSVMDATISQSHLTVSWPTLRTLSGFLDEFLRVWPKPGDDPDVVVGVRRAGLPGLPEKRVHWNDLSARSIERVADGRRISFVRLRTGAMTAWYSLATLRRDLGSDNCHARISIRIIPEAGPLHRIVGLFGETAYEWLFPDLIEEALHGLTHKPFSENERNV